MACEEGMCWADSLSEACDHWKAEVERLRAALRTIANYDTERDVPGPSLIARAALDGPAGKGRP